MLKWKRFLRKRNINDTFYQGRPLDSFMEPIVVEEVDEKYSIVFQSYLNSSSEELNRIGFSKINGFTLDNYYNSHNTESWANFNCKIVNFKRIRIR